MDNRIASTKLRNYLPKFTSAEEQKERKRPSSTIKLDPLIHRSPERRLGRLSTSNSQNKILSRSKSSQHGRLSPISHLGSGSKMIS